MIEQARATGPQSRGPQAVVEAVRSEGAHVSAGSVLAPNSQRLAPTVLGSQDWNTFKEQAAFFIKSGLLPKSVQTIEAALTIMVTGYELGIGPMQALRLISVVQGKPVCAAELMAALIYRDHGDEALRIEDSTAERCEVSYKRRGWSERRSYAFTIEDARTAGLAGKETWKNFPAAMCRARCISAVARMAFPDTISGLYTAEELAPDRVSVSSEGEVTFDAPVVAGPVQPQPLEQGEAATRSAERASGAAESAPSLPTPDSLPASAGTPPTAEWTQRQLGARVRALAGVSLPGLANWQDLARTYGVGVPANGRDMTQPWLLELYQAMQARLVEQRIRQAPDEKELGAVMNGAYDLARNGEISPAQSEQLDAHADRRYEELAGTATPPGGANGQDHELMAEAI